MVCLFSINVRAVVKIDCVIYMRCVDQCLITDQDLYIFGCAYM